MNRLFQLCILLSMCVFLYACPMMSNVPLDTKPHRIDTVLLGKWRNEKKDNSYLEYTITKKSATQYAIKATDVKTSGYMVEYYYATASRINGDFLLCISSKDTTQHGYYVVKLDFASSKNTVKASPISDKNKDTFYNSDEFREWIKNNKTRPDFFDPGDVFDIFHRVK